MSVAGYIGKNVRTPRIPREDALKEDSERKSQEPDRQAETYESVEDYDPVLRAHCRL